MKRTGSLVAFAVLLVVTGRGDSTSPITAPPPAAVSETPSGVAPEDIVRDSRSRLLDAVVTPTDDGFDVAAWWGCVERGCQGRRAIASSSDGFGTAAYEKWTQRAWRSYFPDPPRWSVPAFEGLAQATVWSMEDGAVGVQIVIAGGDGATHKPFQVIGRSSDHGETWGVYEVEPIDGELAYYYGAVGLADGRLLAHLENFTDDGFKSPADRPHDLWISDGYDWTSYAPYRPTFSPPLTPNADGWSAIVDLDVAQGVISVRTWDSKLYVSTDNAATFVEIPARKLPQLQAVHRDES